MSFQSLYRSEKIDIVARVTKTILFQVGWGESTMIQAERLLLEAALDDPANQRFVLLSDRLFLILFLGNFWGFMCFHYCQRQCKTCSLL